MSHAPSFIVDWLRPALRRSVALVGMVALLFAVASTFSTPKADGLYDAHHAAVADCQTGGGDGCASHATGQPCTFHSGCVSTGVVPAGPVVAAVRGGDRIVPSRASVADWGEFPAKPPPILLS